MANPQRGSRAFTIVPADQGNTLEIGPGGTPSATAVLNIQFDPSIDFVGAITIMGKIMGPAANPSTPTTQYPGAPFVGLPYRRLNWNGLPSDGAVVADVISAAGLIQVMAGGISIALMVACSAGSCRVYTWDLQGSPGV